MSIVTGLAKTILQYIDHPESKFNGDIGLLERKHIHVDGVLDIGKEANEIDEQPLHVTDPQIFPRKDEIARQILAIPLEDAGRYDVNKSTLFRMQERIRNTGEVNLNTKLVKNLLGCYDSSSSSSSNSSKSSSS